MRRLPLLMLLLVGCATGTEAGDPSPDASVGHVAIDAADPPDAPDPVVPDAMTPPPDAMESPPDAPVAGGPVDSCAQAQNLTTAALTPGGATVAGDTTGYVDDLQPASSCTGYLPDGPDAVYYVTATAGQTITATVTPAGGWDTSIYIIGACVMVPACLDGADAEVAAPGVETASFTVATAGTYHVVVDAWSAGVQGAYSLHVRVQ